MHFLCNSLTASACKVCREWKTFNAVDSVDSVRIMTSQWIDLAIEILDKNCFECLSLITNDSFLITSEMCAINFPVDLASWRRGDASYHVFNCALIVDEWVYSKKIIKFYKNSNSKQQQQVVRPLKRYYFAVSFEISFKFHSPYRNRNDYCCQLRTI